MAYLGPKWPFSKFQQSTLCGYSKIVSRDAWHHAKWINKFDHQFLGKMAQKWHNRTQKWPFSKYQQSTLLGPTRPKMAIFKVTAKYLLWVLYTCVKRCLTLWILSWLIWSPNLDKIMNFRVPTKGTSLKLQKWPFWAQVGHFRAIFRPFLLKICDRNL